MASRTFLVALGIVTVACGPAPEARAPGDSAASAATHARTPDMLRGVSLAGAEFGEHTLPGTFMKEYVYPSPDYVPGYSSPQRFAKQGMNHFRLPFRWERLQPKLSEPFDDAELERLTTTVGFLQGLDARVVLDPHNYGRYRDHVIGSDELPIGHFVDFWQRLAEIYKSDARVIFGLMNEPHDMPSEQWRDAANAAIAGIRAVGAKNLILVPGNGWSGAHSWNQDWYGSSNAQLMLTIEDPADHIAFEVHQYLDSDSSGRSDTCVSEQIGVERLKVFTAWAIEHERRGYLGEFNGGNNDTCRSGVQRMLEHVESTPEVYVGWAYWAAGPWWGEHPRALEPKQGQAAPQMAWLLRWLQ
jgi:endoglucanase